MICALNLEKHASETRTRPLNGSLVSAAATPLLLYIPYPWGRAILGGSKQLLVVVEKLVRRHEALDPQPGLPRRRSHERHRGVAHLLATVDVKGLLCRDARRDGAGVVLPLGSCMEFAGVLGKARRRVLLRVDRGRK